MTVSLNRLAMLNSPVGGIYYDSPSEALAVADWLT